MKQPMQNSKIVGNVETTIHEDNAQHTRKYVATAGKITTSEVYAGEAWVQGDHRQRKAGTCMKFNKLLRKMMSK